MTTSQGPLAHAALLGDLQAFESGPIRRISSEYQAQISILSPQPRSSMTATLPRGHVALSCDGIGELVA